MPAVLVHGHPETAAVWRPVAGELTTETTLVELPGYGQPRPLAFTATKDAYTQWLVGELEHFDHPVDLVGHDWGAILVVRVACLRPDLLRSWVVDAAIATLHTDHCWHQMARVWQTPGQGEAFVEAALASSDADALAGFAPLGMPGRDAINMRKAWDETLWECALLLYRSAIDIDADWGSDLGRATARPGLVVVPGRDWTVQSSWVEDCARRAGARIVNLPGLGHWWFLEDPRHASELLENFWASVAAPVSP